MPNKPKPVVLVSPEGVESEVTSPTAFNNLVYGQGYKPKTGTADEAYTKLVSTHNESAAGQTPTPRATTPTPVEKDK